MNRPVADFDRVFPSRSRAADFGRRAVLYSQFDAKLSAHTRFFAAASIINATLAKFFAIFPGKVSPSFFTFLSKVGAALETDNLLYAKVVQSQAPGSALDVALVLAEQSRVQRLVRMEEMAQEHRWESTRDELNAFLNDRYAASRIYRWWWRGDRLYRVLREVRSHLRVELDFAVESHRIWIGRKLIEDIRRESSRSRLLRTGR